MIKDDFRKVQYLYLIGRIYTDNRLKLRPGYLTDEPNMAKEDPDSPLVAKLYDGENQLLLRYGVPLSPYLAEGRALTELAIRATIPFPPPTRYIRFYRDDVMLHEIVVSEGKPEVRITWKPPRNVKGRQIITWEGKHPQNQPLQYFLLYTHNNGETWQPTGWRTDATAQEIDFDRFPGGRRCRVAVLVTDGVNTVRVASKLFSVPVKPCVALIFAPEDGTTFDQSDLLFLRGQGFYLEENRAETEALIWNSSKDGELGRGMTLRVSELSLGRHRITLTAGVGKRAGETTISVQIGKSE